MEDSHPSLGLEPQQDLSTGESRIHRVMTRLPAELLNIITTNLSVDDVRSLYQAASRSKEHVLVAKCCLARISVQEYIECSLGNSSIVLGAMSRNLVYISGSRALEFFKRGVTDTHSDWDFYAPNDFDLVSAFMQGMEQAGVTWRSPLDQIRKLMREDGGMVRLQREAFAEVLENDALFEAATDMNFVVREEEDVEDLSNQSPFRNIVINTVSKTITVEGGSMLQDYDDILFIKRVIRGELRNDRRTVEIQLMVEDRDHPFDTASIFRFHSSVVQCYLGPHVACHFYGAKTSSGITHVWQGYINNAKNERAIRKYRERGFLETSVEMARGFQIRHADGDQATFIGGYNYSNAEKGLVQDQVAHARRTMWIETPKKTEFMDRPISVTIPKYYRKIYQPLNEAKKVAAMYTPHPVAQLWAVGKRETKLD
ncbi:hypothetical protein N0V90_008571 [Kalmusia sp. IMI 367209]|nr:hypothetical protein N0V90_008571 [Kalmusia sp. IMI 367209]